MYEIGYFIFETLLNILKFSSKLYLDITIKYFDILLIHIKRKVIT